MVMQVVVAKILVMMLDLVNSECGVDEGLKDIHGQLYRSDF